MSARLWLMANRENESKSAIGWATPEQYLVWLEQQYPPGHIVPKYVREEFYNPGSVKCYFNSTPTHIAWVAEALWKVSEMEDFFYHYPKREIYKRGNDSFGELRYVSLKNIGENRTVYVEGRLASQPPGKSKKLFGDCEVVIIGPFKESVNSKPYREIADINGVCWIGGQLFKGLYQVAAESPWYMQVVGGRKNFIKPVAGEIKNNISSVTVVECPEYYSKPGRSAINQIIL